MQSPEPFRIFTRKLHQLGVPYMVSGSVAAIYYGEPRMTNDVDIIVFLKREDASRLEKAFPGDEFYCPPCEVIEIEAAREQRGHFNLIHHDTGFKADIYLMGRDELHEWGMARVQVAVLDGEPVRFAPPEYVMIRKLQFFKEGGSRKHLRDINRMVVSLGPAWDRRDLQEMIRKYDLGSGWEMAIATD